MRRLSVYLIALILWLCSAIPVMASPVATSSATAESPHELRLGFSDSFIPADRMQRSINADYWHTPSPSSVVEGMPVDEADAFLRQYERSLYSHIYNTGHFFVEYQYRLTRVISVGIDANMAAIGATCRVSDGYNTTKAQYSNHIYVWSALPTVRFCYLEHPHIRLYLPSGASGNPKNGMDWQLGYDWVSRSGFGAGLMYSGYKSSYAYSNMETVRRISPQVRSAAKYDVSLSVLRRIAERGVVAKTGIMVGLGETGDEVLELMDDVLLAGVSVLTIGQYLQPSRKNIPVSEYVTPECFEYYRQQAVGKGFKKVESAPLVRSSYHAEKHI